MSYSHESVSDQVKDISTIVKMVAGCSVIPDRVTNKRMIIRCSGRHVARNLEYNLRASGYPMSTAAAGLKTDFYYVEVRFNYPF